MNTINNTLGMLSIDATGHIDRLMSLYSVCHSTPCSQDGYLPVLRGIVRHPTMTVADPGKGVHISLSGGGRKNSDSSGAFSNACR